MPVENDAALRHLARRLLEHELGNSQDPGDIARAADGVSRKLFGQMRPLVGPLGFLSVLNRALLLTKRSFAFLYEVRVDSTEVPVDSTDGMELGGLREALEGRERLQAMEAIEALVYTCVCLLVGLLGSRLTYKYLQAAWPELDID